MWKTHKAYFHFAQVSRSPLSNTILLVLIVGYHKM
jgi:hypothetical protein